MMTVHDQFQGVGLVYTTLKRTFGDDFDAKANCSQIAFTKDYKSAIFDLPCELDEQLQGYWKDSARMQLKTITELPEIDESSITTNSRGSYGGNRGGSGNRGGGQRGGGDSNVCFNCQQPGHFSRECPTARKSGGGDNKCFNCQQTGHMSRDCPEPRSGGRSGGGGDSNCFNCQKPGHMSRDCPEPRSGGRSGGGGDNKCFNCQEEGHQSRDCPQPRKSGGFGGGRGGSRGSFGGGGGGRGSFGGGRGGGAKRSFETSNGESATNKKIKFDDADE